MYLFRYFDLADLLKVFKIASENTHNCINIYCDRLGTLSERISEAQPFASSAMLELLSRSIDEAQATIAATEATVNEGKRSFCLL